MIWETLLETAKRAPSPHNVQPWLIRVTDASSADLFIVRERTLPKEDLTGSFLLSAMTIFVTTLKEVARNYGYSLEHSYDHIPDPNASRDRISFGTLHLEESRNSDLKISYPLDLIRKRKTSRLPNWKKPVPESVRTTLTTFCSYEGQTLHIVSDPMAVESIIEQNTSALFADLNTPDYHDELASWLRISDRHAETTGDGLDRRCMKLPAIPMHLMVGAPQLLIAPLLKNISSRYYRTELGHVQYIGLISGSFWKPEDALRSGEFLARFWLELARHDLQIHPFGNLVTNRPANKWLSDRFNLNSIWFVFRMGYTDEAPVSKRLPNQKIIEYALSV